MTDRDKKELVGHAIAKEVQTVMEHHYYVVGGQLYRQADGCSMGLDLTSVKLAYTC